MSINWKTALSLVSQHYLAPTVAVMLFLAPAAGYVWNEYKQIQKEKDQLTSERKSFYEERLLSERNRVDTTTALLTKQSELDKREFALQQLEEQNKERLAALKQRTAEYEAAAGKLQQAAASVSQAQQLKEVEEKLSKLMSEFSSMGVNLNDTLRCGDSEALAKYNSAKAKYSEIYTLAEASRLTARYKHFFFKNGQSMYSACTS